MPARVAGFVLLIILMALTAGIHARTVSAQSYVANHVLVKFANGASPSCRDSAITHLGASLADSLKLINYYVLQLPDTSVLAAIAYLDSCHCVAAVQPNGIVSGTTSPLLLAPDDDRYPDLWHLNNTGQSGGSSGADINAEKGWD